MIRNLRDDSREHCSKRMFEVGKEIVKREMRWNRDAIIFESCHEGGG